MAAIQKGAGLEAECDRGPPRGNAGHAQAALAWKDPGPLSPAWKHTHSHMQGGAYLETNPLPNLGRKLCTTAWPGEGEGRQEIMLGV